MGDVFDFSSEDWFADPTKWPTPFIAMTEECRPATFDVILLTVNEEEFKAAVQKFLVPTGKLLKAHVGSLTVFFGEPTLHVNALSLGLVRTGMGVSNQQMSVSEVITKLNPKAIISVGVGWGNPARKPQGVKEGDVMIASHLVEFTVNTKCGKDGSFNSRSEHPGTGLQAFGLLGKFSQMAYPGMWSFSSGSDGGAYRVHKAWAGKLATGGLLLNNIDLMERLTSSMDYEDCIGGDMEAWGLYMATQQVIADGKRAAPGWIVVKGICDWGSEKSAYWQPLAAAAACNLVHTVLSEPGVLSTFGNEDLASINISPTVILDDGKHLVNDLAEFLTHALRLGAWIGDTHRVRQILAGVWPNINGFDKSGMAPIHLATQSGNNEMVAILIDLGADVDLVTSERGGLTPLQIAARNGHLEMAKLLLDKGASVNVAGRYGKAPVELAACGNHHKMVELLLDSNADVFSPPVSGWCPLAYASEKGDVEMVKLCLAKKVDPNKDEGLPLKLAALGAHHKVVEELLLRGAKWAVIAKKCSDWQLIMAYVVETRDLVTFEECLRSGVGLNDTNHEGSTALALASACGRVDIVKLLLDKKANVNWSDDSGDTPLHHAIAGGHIEVIKMLLQRQADPHISNEQECTPIWAALRGASFEVAELVLRNLGDSEFDVNVFDEKANWNPLMYAAYTKKKDLLEYFLREKKANINGVHRCCGSGGGEFSFGDGNYTPLQVAVLVDFGILDTPLQSVEKVKETMVDFLLNLDGLTPPLDVHQRGFEDMTAVGMILENNGCKMGHFPTLAMLLGVNISNISDTDKGLELLLTELEKDEWKDDIRIIQNINESSNCPSDPEPRDFESEVSPRSRN